MQKVAELYRGKSKTIYTTSDPNYVILEFRNHTSAMDGKRIQSFDRKGIINNKFNNFIMNKLESEGIPTQMESLFSDNEALVKKLDMIPIEYIIRNRTAGSLVKRLGISENQVLHYPLFEMFLKNDKLHDPIVSEDHCKAFGWVSEVNLMRIKKLSYKINDVLSKFFYKNDLILVDLKLEFGLFYKKIILGDEISPDCCRLWDKNTLEKMDKDLFRGNLGGMIEAYEKVSKRIGVY